MDTIKKVIQIVQCENIRVHLPLMRVFIEFADALKVDSNWEIKTIERLQDLKDEGIILMGNDFGPKDKVRYDIINYLSKFTKGIFIVWYWKHNLPHYDTPERELLQKVIHTSEEKLCPILEHKDIFNYYNSLPNYVPLLLRANEPIEQIGKNERIDKRMYCFMGSSYGMHMIPTKYDGLYHRADVNGFLDYETRKQIYLTSIFALGYHGEEPITQKSISQRIFEGLAYGCIVLTNSQYAVEYTDNICIYVNSLQDVEREIEYYYNNIEKRKEKQELGYEWMRKNRGTNRVAWKLFFDKIEELKYYQDFSSVFVNCLGGLGNQIFQIANGFVYAKKYNKSFFLSKSWNGLSKERPSYWDSVLQSCKDNLCEKDEFKNSTLYKESKFNYSLIPFIEGNVSFEGYFQSETYFEDYSEDLRKFLNIYPKKDNSKDIISRDVISKEIVAIHIRRGDYLKHPEFHTILTKTYYDEAKKIIEEKLGYRPNYKYFSEDTKWVNEQFKDDLNEDDEVVLPKSDIEEFQEMINCDHFILANSSFSWWASWFSDFDRKIPQIVIAPKEWFGVYMKSQNQDWSSVYRKHWIQI